LYKNAFAEKLASFSFDPYAMLVVDLMHEFELGVWKSTLIHIIRLLHAAAPGGHMVAEFNARYAIVVFSFHLLELEKVPANSNIWPRHYPTVL
jgi:hypothetical protein